MSDLIYSTERSYPPGPFEAFVAFFFTTFSTWTSDFGEVDTLAGFAALATFTFGAGAGLSPPEGRETDGSSPIPPPPITMAPRAAPAAPRNPWVGETKRA